MLAPCADLLSEMNERQLHRNAKASLEAPGGCQRRPGMKARHLAFLRLPKPGQDPACSPRTAVLWFGTGSAWAARQSPGRFYAQTAGFCGQRFCQTSAWRKTTRCFHNVSAALHAPRYPSSSGHTPHTPEPALMPESGPQCNARILELGILAGPLSASHNFVGDSSPGPEPTSWMKLPLLHEKGHTRRAAAKNGSSDGCSLGCNMQARSAVPMFGKCLVAEPAKSDPAYEVSPVHPSPACSNCRLASCTKSCNLPASCKSGARSSLAAEPGLRSHTAGPGTETSQHGRYHLNLN